MTVAVVHRRDSRAGTSSPSVTHRNLVSTRCSPVAHRNLVAVVAGSRRNCSAVRNCHTALAKPYSVVCRKDYGRRYCTLARHIPDRRNPDHHCKAEQSARGECMACCTTYSQSPYHLRKPKKRFNFFCKNENENLLLDLQNKQQIRKRNPQSRFKNQLLLRTDTVLNMNHFLVVVANRACTAALKDAEKRRTVQKSYYQT